MSSRFAVLALMILPLAACEGMNLPGGEEAAAPTGPRPPAVSPLEQPIETGASEARPVSTAERSTYETVAFSARGNEPFWAVDVAGNTAIYKTPENQRGTPVRVNRLTFGEGVEFIGVHGGRPFVVNVRGARCQDTMSGERFPMTATLTVSGRTERGCAGPATAEVAAAVSATRAPAPAEPRARRVTRQPAAAARPAATPAPAAQTPAATEAPATTAPATTAPADTPATTTAPAPSTTPAPAATTPAPAATTPATPAPAATTPAPATTAPATTVPAPALVLPSTPPTTGAAAPAAPAADGDDATAD